MSCVFLDICVCGHIRDEHAAGFFSACTIEGCAPPEDEDAPLITEDGKILCVDFELETEHVED